jgi:hypothetical protein
LYDIPEEPVIITETNPDTQEEMEYLLDGYPDQDYYIDDVNDPARRLPGYTRKTNPRYSRYRYGVEPTPVGREPEN